MGLPVVSWSNQAEPAIATLVRKYEASETNKPAINNSSEVSIVNTTAQQIDQLAQAKPVNILSAVIGNITKINDSAKTAREADRDSGIGLIKGASDFNRNVSGIYNFLLAVAPTISGEDSGRKLLELSKQYSLAKGQESLLINANSGAQTQKPAQAGAVLSTVTATDSVDDMLGKAGSTMLGAAGAAYSIYELAQGKTEPIPGAVQGMATGAYIGSYFGAPAVGAVLGGIAGAVSGLFKKSGKSVEQKERDLIRKHLRQAGVLDSNWNIKLANGALFDMGKDGGAKLISLNGSLRRYKEFDLSNPLTEDVAQTLIPLAEAITGGHPRLTQEFTAYLTNAANSNANTFEESMQNVKVLYAQFGLSFEEVLKKLAQTQSVIK